MNSIYNNPIINNLSSIPKIQFRQKQAVYKEAYSPYIDSFSTNPIYENFDSKTNLNRMASSSEVVRILKENNIPLKVNYKEYEKLKKNHLSDTRVIAAKIYSALPAELKSQVNLQDLQQAAMLHDFGKILIPDNILNKHGPLTDKEKEIVALHSELGYEMLKNQNLNKNVLNLIKYHHQLPNGSGYPKIKEDYLPDKASEILMAADKYSALRE